MVHHLRGVYNTGPLGGATDYAQSMEMSGKHLSGELFHKLILFVCAMSILCHIWQDNGFAQCLIGSYSIFCSYV